MAKRTISSVLNEWHTRKRQMNSYAATKWFCKRLPEFKPQRLTFYNADGDCFQHVVASNGWMTIDLVPHLNKANAFSSPFVQWQDTTL